MQNHKRKTVTIETRRKLRRIAKARWARIRAAQATGQPPRIVPPSPLEAVTTLYAQVRALDRTSYEFFRTLLGQTTGTKTGETPRTKMTGAKLARARERARRASQIRWARHRERQAEATRQAS